MAKLAFISVLVLIATLVVMAPGGKILEAEAATPPRKLREIDHQEKEMLIKLPAKAMSSKIGVPYGEPCSPYNECDPSCHCAYIRFNYGICEGDCE
ncbi:unnamed protein product [Coffea canephora]|uniref:Uncharacterized protein n=1 Tax=Coffea canephora TaxID=49390 RepID=A0A068URF4_COFCA|nr:unnamed protein product [Coffea canephora]